MNIEERHKAWECGLPGYLQRDLDAYKEGLRTNSTLLDCLLRYNLPILIIESQQRAEYLSCMKSFRTDAHPLVDFFFHTAIARMKKEIEAKKNATENFRLGWENPSIIINQ